MSSPFCDICVPLMTSPPRIGGSLERGVRGAEVAGAAAEVVGAAVAFIFLSNLWMSETQQGSRHILDVDFAFLQASIVTYCGSTSPGQNRKAR